MTGRQWSSSPSCDPLPMWLATTTTERGSVHWPGGARQTSFGLGGAVSLLLFREKMGENSAPADPPNASYVL